MLNAANDLADWLKLAYRREPVELLVAVLSTMVFGPLTMLVIRFGFAVWLYVPGTDSILVFSVLAGLAGLCIYMAVSVWSRLAGIVSHETWTNDR